MRAMLHLLMMLAVMLAALHVGEAHAHESATEHALERSVAASDDIHPSSPSNSADQTHHHCPVAATRNVTPQLPMRALAAALHFPLAAGALGSLSQAPPIEPPLT